MDLSLSDPQQKSPKQARSRARRDALLALGAQALNSQELDEISVADLSRQLGYSTGSFYSYFDDKEHFFVSVQVWVNEDMAPDFEAAFDPDHLATLRPEARLRQCLRFAITYFRKWTGVIRSALRYERRIPRGWAPNRQRTMQIVAAAKAGLDADQAQRIETALQFGFGLLVNAVLHDPGPLKLSDPDLEDRVMAVLTPFLAMPKQT